METFSRLDQVLYVNLKPIIYPGKHILVTGGAGSGKTSTLLLLAKLFYDNNETIIWRDDSSLEFLSLADEVAIKVFVPRNCKLNYTNPNVEFFEYDPKNIFSILNNLDQQKINAVLFDLFCFDIGKFIKFWKDFFYALYKWKRTKMGTAVTFFTDELNDLAAGARRGYIPKQLSLASNIFFSLKKYRKEKIRLVASTHGFNDLHKPVRDSFNFYIIRKMRREAVPDRFANYTHLIEKLNIDEGIVVDEEGAFNRMNFALYVKPRNINVTFEGDIEELETHREMKVAVRYRQKLAISGKALLDNNVVKSYDELAQLWGISAGEAWKIVNEKKEA